MFLCVLNIMKTADASNALMVAANAPFQAEKLMLLGSLYHEGHVMYHPFPSRQHEPAVAYYRKPSEKKHSHSKVFFFGHFFGFTCSSLAEAPKLSFFNQISTMSTSGHCKCTEKKTIIIIIIKITIMLIMCNQRLEW